jgi:NADP-dependent 3-hydroxy acid dehydrogenase YdfG
MILNLKNKIVLLTGAGKGIGKQILDLLIKEKLIVYAVTRNKKDFVRVKKNRNVNLFYGDVRNQKTIDEIFLRAKKKNIFLIV